MQTLAQVRALLDEIAPQYGVQKAYLFGSVVKAGRFREGSDVDVAVLDMEPGAFFETFFAMLMLRRLSMRSCK